ncbi:unnamed protein product [Rangifer tarandus platyrhynchus]|uniref:Uncharacterized protein n=1 Tax=Rangifer tarandus platyrhynchus TaxID=3082113 RepID=A0ABN8Y8P7_RANTA|nr:unnamed protein product [Rangifer tarandus platyrhynchus]
MVGALPLLFTSLQEDCGFLKPACAGEFCKLPMALSPVGNDTGHLTNQPAYQERSGIPGALAPGAAEVVGALTYRLLCTSPQTSATDKLYPNSLSSNPMRARDACSGQPADLDSSFKTNLRPLTFSANPPAKLKSPDVPFPWGDSTSLMSLTLCQHAEFPCRLASVSSHRSKDSTRLHPAGTQLAPSWHVRRGSRDSGHRRRRSGLTRGGAQGPGSPATRRGGLPWTLAAGSASGLAGRPAHRILPGSELRGARGPAQQAVARKSQFACTGCTPCPALF